MGASSARFGQVVSLLGATACPPGARPDLVPGLVDTLPAGDIGPPGEFGEGLPAGVVEHCTALALALGAVAGSPVSGVGVAVQVRLPEVMAAAYGSTRSMTPAPPRPVAGGGFVHADLGAPGDTDAFETLLSTLPPGATAREVAEAAQEWRLAVCEYRPPAAPGPGGGPPWSPWSFGPGPVPTGPVGRPARVLDLTNMWAGPLATWLLQSLGWSVTKVEPSFRPDGFRSLDGRGIHPGDRQCDPGQDSAMWNALNGGKRIVDLDLRLRSDRDRFVDLAAESDVVIDSFSPRVMANFGLRLPEGPLYASIPAFPPGPRRDWVAYGTGIHALSGLGDVGRSRPVAPAVSYPDPVAGFTAALAVAAAVTGRRRGVPIGRLECPLSSAVQPLLASATGGGPSPLVADCAGVGARLFAVARSAGLLEPRTVCGRPLLHPRGVFVSKQNVF